MYYQIIYVWHLYECHYAGLWLDYIYILEALWFSLNFDIWERLDEWLQISHMETNNITTTVSQFSFWMHELLKNFASTYIYLRYVPRSPTYYWNAASVFCALHFVRLSHWIPDNLSDQAQPLSMRKFKLSCFYVRS